MPDWSKALEFLKLGCGKTAAIAIAAFLLLLANRQGLVPPLDAWAVQLTTAVFLLCGMLTLVAIGAGFLNLLAIPWGKFKDWLLIRKSKRLFREYVPHLSERERIIFGYLLHHNMRAFTADHDWGYAAKLIALKFIWYIGAPGQSFDADKCPMEIPKHVWDVL